MMRSVSSGHEETPGAASQDLSDYQPCSFQNETHQPPLSRCFATCDVFWQHGRKNSGYFPCGKRRVRLIRPPARPGGRGHPRSRQITIVRLRGSGAAGSVSDPPGSGLWMQIKLFSFFIKRLAEKTNPRSCSAARHDSARHCTALHGAVRIKAAKR
ncbi:uncharacterized protein V6R79_005776 [Siganus canaliculatus]